MALVATREAEATKREAGIRNTMVLLKKRMVDQDLLRREASVAAREAAAIRREADLRGQMSVVDAGRSDLEADLSRREADLTRRELALRSLAANVLRQQVQAEKAERETQTNCVSDLDLL